MRATCARLVEIGVDELDLGETLGVATPDEVARVIERCAAVRPASELVLHLHDTRGMAVASAMRALELGVRKFDASTGGIGGCPYAPGAAGNVATERLVAACRERGYRTSVDSTALGEAASFIRRALGAA